MTSRLCFVFDPELKNLEAGYLMILVNIFDRKIWFCRQSCFNFTQRRNSTGNYLFYFYVQETNNVFFMYLSEKSDSSPSP
jgi:hypothetical protein